MSTTPTDTTPETGQPPQQRLTVLGPNLFGASTTFRVHAEGCRDIARDEAKYGGQGDGGWTEPFASKGEVADNVYDFLGGEHSEDGDPTLPQHRPGMLDGEFHFAPCVTLPDHTPDQDDPDGEEQGVTVSVDFFIRTGPGVDPAQVAETVEAIIEHSTIGEAMRDGLDRHDHLEYDGHGTARTALRAGSIMGPDEVPGGLHNPATLPNAIREFRAACVRDEYTDTGTVWELLDQAELLLDTIAEAVGL